VERKRTNGPGLGTAVGVAALLVVGLLVYQRSVPPAPPTGIPDAGQVTADAAPALAPEEVPAQGALEDAGPLEALPTRNFDAGFEVSLEPAAGVAPDDEEGLDIQLGPVDDAGSGAVRVQRTDDHGVAHFGHLAAGRYLVALRDPRFAEISEETDIAEGGNETLVMVLDESADVSGDVRDAEGRPVAGVGLTFGPDSSFSLTSAADGTFVCRRCPASATQLDIDAPEGFAEVDSKTIALRRGSNPPLHLVLQRMRPLEVVVDFGGVPPAAGETRVELQGPDGFAASRELGADDRARFDEVPPQDVRAEVEDGTGPLGEVAVPAGAKSVELRLPANALDVEVTGPIRSRSHPSAVVVQCQGGEPRAQLPDRGGRAHFRWLPPRPCEVDFESQAKATVTPPGHVTLELAP
jgi:hypothetical protein